jgi:hypothetical protein
VGEDALTKLQLSGKGYTNGPSPYDRMQLILKLPTSSTQISSPPLVLKYHINTVSITSFLTNNFKARKEESKGNQTLETLQNVPSKY